MTSTPAISVLYDLRYYQASIEELEEYLLSGLRDWPLLISPPAASPPYPRLSPGALLLCRRRLHPTRLDPAQTARITDLDEMKDVLCERWLSAWHDRINLDFGMNLVLWQNYLQDSQDQGAYYHAEVRQRVILTLLTEETQSSPLSSHALLAGLDAKLRRVLVNGGFIWQKDLIPAFPQEPFWYLYGQIGIAA